MFLKVDNADGNEAWLNEYELVRELKDNGDFRQLVKEIVSEMVRENNDQNKEVLREWLGVK